MVVAYYILAAIGMVALNNLLISLFFPFETVNGMNDVDTNILHPSHRHLPIGQACNNGTKSSKSDTARLLLLVNTQPEHGSTAILSLLMSSPKVSTLCQNNLYQCEGFKTATDHVCGRIGGLWCFRHGGGFHNLPPTSPFLNPKEYSILDEHSLHWDLDKPLFIDKLFPNEPGYTKLVDLAFKDEVPSNMKRHGIRHLDQAHLFVWTPLCSMALHSSVFHRLIGNANNALKVRSWKDELLTLQIMQQQHETFLQNNVPVLVINYSDLLFNEERTLRRLESFLPCADHLSTDFVPQLGVHIFEGNEWKVRGSIRSYALSKRSFLDDCCVYKNSASTVCKNTIG